MEKLNIDVKYSALYRPQAIGMLERQHQGLKNSIKAALIDMGQTHQDRWLDFLPFVLLGRRVAYQPDIGASSSEMTFGKNVTVPGEILCDPDTTSDYNSFQKILNQVRNKTDNEAIQPSRHNLPETQLPDIPLDVTHVYTRQHNTTGLQAHFEGPFRIAERVSRSVLKLEVGTYKGGQKRYEFRHLNDIKLAHPKSLAAPAERPKLGRPSATPTSTSSDGSGPTGIATPEGATNPSNQLTDLPVDTLPEVQSPPSVPDSESKQTFSGREPAKIQTSKLPRRSTRNPNPIYVDSIMTGPPPTPPFTTPRAWTASGEELAWLNQSINATAIC